MIERLATGARRLDGNDDVLLDALLTDEVGHALGTHAGIEARVSLEGPAGYDACWRLRHDGFVLRHDTYFVSVALLRAFLRRAFRLRSSVDLLAAARALLCRLAQLLEG